VYTKYTISVQFRVVSWILATGCWFFVYRIMLCVHSCVQMKAFKARLGRLYTMYTEYTKNFYAGVRARMRMTLIGHKIFEYWTEFNHRSPSTLSPQQTPISPEFSSLSPSPIHRIAASVTRTNSPTPGIPP
jgi:hypothetical protein